MPKSPQKDAFINKIWFSRFLANWISTGLSRRRGGQGGLGAFPPGKGRGECTTGAYTAWKIFEARPSPRHPAGRTPAASHVPASQVLPGGHHFRRESWGFCFCGIWASGKVGAVFVCGAQLLAPFLLPAKHTPGWGAGGGPPTPQSLVAHQWGSNSLVWYGSGNVARAFLAASVDLTPRNSPPEPTCAGSSSCPNVSPPVPTLSLSRDLGGLNSGRAGAGDVGCNRDIAGCNGHRQVGTCPLFLGLFLVL